MKNCIVALVGLFVFVAAAQAQQGSDSIVDYLKAKEIDSSMENRKVLFSKRYSKQDYKGTEEQNLQLLLDLLKEDKAARQMRWGV